MSLILSLLVLTQPAAVQPDLHPELAKALPILMEKLHSTTIQGTFIPGAPWVTDPLELKPTDTGARLSKATRSLPDSACDDTDDCGDEMDDACSDAGHGDCEEGTVKLVEVEGGGSICSCACENNGAHAFKICN